MSLTVLGSNGGGGYNLESSLRFRSSASAYLNRTPASAGNRKTFTYSAWVKRGLLSGSSTYNVFASGQDGNNWLFFGFRNDSIYYDVSWTSSDNRIIVRSANLFRDTSAWYHVVFSVDTTQATNTNRIRLYVNNQLITSYTYIIGSGYIPQNTDTYINTTNIHGIGYRPIDNDSYFDGYMTEINFVDGQALTPSDFGEYDAITGVWKPKRYTSTYGTNGFYLNFSDGTSTITLGYDQSPNSNNWTTNNISLTAGATYDLMSDVPTLTDEDTANFATLNPLNKAGSPTLSAANLDIQAPSASYVVSTSTMAIPSTGKFYYETVLTTRSSSSYDNEDVLIGEMPFVSGNTLSTVNTFYAMYAAYRYHYLLPGGPLTDTGVTCNAGDIMQLAYDADTGKLWWGVNNTWFSSGNPATGANPIYTYTLPRELFIALRMYGTSGKLSANFGQRPFAYTPPTGFKKLNTYNLPDSTIKDGSQYFDATTYTGDGATTKTITNASGFKPDFIWVKGRSNTGSHLLQDSNRGFGTATKLSTNSTNPENNSSGDATDPIYGYVTAANSNGFTVNVGTTPAQTNNNGVTYVGWQWRASDSSPVSNTDGTITSTVSANTTSGFSIVTYTGNGSSGTVGHGLGVAPKMVIVKRRDGTFGWNVYHIGLTSASYVLFLQATDAQATSSLWNSTAPTSSVFSLGTSSGGNASGGSYVAYCFAEVEGFSKFGSYTGNGSADGPFVYTGFRPKFLMFKTTTIIGHWVIVDTERNTYNVIDNSLYPDTYGSEINTITDVDFLSNGFKWRGVLANETNVSGHDYIYIAFAENPFKNSLAR